MRAEHLTQFEAPAGADDRPPVHHAADMCREEDGDDAVLSEERLSNGDEAPSAIRVGTTTGELNGTQPSITV